MHKSGRPLAAGAGGLRTSQIGLPDSTSCVSNNQLANILSRADMQEKENFFILPFSVLPSQHTFMLSPLPLADQYDRIVCWDSERSAWDRVQLQRHACHATKYVKSPDYTSGRWDEGTGAHLAIIYAGK